MGKIKWIGGGLGFVLGGPIGALVGFLFGAVFDDIADETFAVDNKKQQTTGNRYDTQPGDFAVVLLILTSSVLKSDGSAILKSELNYVKEYFKRQFGLEKTKQYILLLREVLQKDYDLKAICIQVRAHLNMASRLQLIHYLFGVAQSDGHIHANEINTIQLISTYLGIVPADFNSIKAMYIRSADSAYTILEIDKNVSNEDVRKAYKRMAVKYHPDKVSHLGEDVRKAAEEKFKKINEAYSQIKKERGMS